MSLLSLLSFAEAEFTITVKAFVEEPFFFFFFEFPFHHIVFFTL